MKSFFHSFVYAFQGILLGLRERNMLVHIFITLIALSAGVFFHITQIEWVAIAIAITLVISAELINTAIEKVCDAVVPLHADIHQLLGKPKDLAAGAVLVAAVGAVSIGLLIFTPYILRFTPITELLPIK